MILSRDLLHGTVHHPTKFQADNWNPKSVRAVTSSPDQVLADSGNLKGPRNAQKLAAHSYFK